MGKQLKVLQEESHTHEGGGACGSGMQVLNPTSQGKRILPKDFKGRACIITLGCAKNQVDSEVMLGALAQRGYDIVTDAAEAEVIIVNTCGFLESSVKESIDRILEAADLKETGRCRQLLVAGCMVERYRSELREAIPEVDSFVNLDDILKIGQIAEGAEQSVLDRAARPYFLYDDTMPRRLSTPKYTAYVKISEGCNRPCTFCIIPRIRGAMRSREIASVVREINDLGAGGVREINYVAQDLTAYGSDRKVPGANHEKLAELLRAVDASGAVGWQRLLYAYPIGVDSELLRTIVDLPSVVEYVDIPLQHSSELVLKPMQRPLGQYSPRRVVEKIRKEAPQIAIRTTFIVGFPGETEADVDDLEQFIREGHFCHVGIFTYSREVGTPSHDLEGHLPEKVKEERRKRLMAAQQEMVTARLESFLGQELEVLIEGTHPETDLLLSARARFQAPDIDGSVIINDIDPECEGVTPGQFGRLVVTEVAGYDLVGRLTRIG
jgi:ribosomal protein S12 methylthiotransferase